MSKTANASSNSVVIYKETDGGSRLPCIPCESKTRKKFKEVGIVAYRQLPENKGLGSSAAKKKYWNEYMPELAKLNHAAITVGVATGEIFCSGVSTDKKNGTIYPVYKRVSFLKAKQDDANKAVDSTRTKAAEKAAAETAKREAELARQASIDILVAVGMDKKEAATYVDLRNEQLAAEKKLAEAAEKKAEVVVEV